MKFVFENDVKAADFWRLSMKQTYRSLVGICNIVFTVAVILLACRFWSVERPALNGILLLACILFPVIQPMCAYLYAMKQVEGIPGKMTLSFDEEGLCVATSTENERISWKQIPRIIKEKNMILLFSASNRGYMLTNRMLGKQKDEFYRYAVEHMKR